MDRSLLRNASPGFVVTTDDDEAAFVPNDLPPNVELPASTLALYAKAMESIGELRGLTSVGALPDPEMAHAPLLRKEARASSTIEGTTVGEEELVRFARQTKTDASAKTNEDAREVLNYFVALDQGEQALSVQPLNLWLVRAMHRTLLGGVRGRNLRPGEFRKGQVHIGSDHRFTPAPGHQVTELMEILEQYWSAPGGSLPALVRIFLIHYQFEVIHPFRDGNGRIGRVLIALMIWKWCGLNRPWCYLSPYFEQYRSEYMYSLFRVTTHGEWVPWIDFCLRGVHASCAESIEQIRKLAALRADWHERVSSAGMKPRAILIVDSLLRLPATTRNDVAEIAGVSFNTASRILRKLEEIGILESVEDGRTQVFVATDVVRITERG